MNRTHLAPLLLIVAAFATLGLLVGATASLASGGGKAPADRLIMRDTTIQDFNLGSLYHTQLEPRDDGAVALQSIGLAGGWHDTHADGMPPRYFHASVVVGNHVYVFGGQSGGLGAPYATCYMSTVQADHTLSTWTAVSSLPRGLDAMAAVGVNNFVYVLGGFDGTNARAEIYRATVNANGTLSAWTADRSMPEAVAHLGATAVNGYIYVLGGEPDTPPASHHTYFAHVGANGALGTWTPTTDLPAPDYDTGASGHIVTSYGDPTTSKVFIATGFSGKGTAVPSVYSATADPSSGVLSAWTRNTNYGQNLVYSAGAAYGSLACGGNLYFSGGLQNQNQQATDYVATAVLSSPPEYFAGGWYTTSNLGIARYGHTMLASDDGWLYVIDGSDSQGNPIASVRYGETACAAAGGAVRAPSGTFQSRVFNTGHPSPLYDLRFNTTITPGVPITLTFTYRASNDPGFVGANWSDPLVATAGISHTTIITLSTVYQYLQYHVDFGRDDSVLTQSPVLNWVTLSYEGNPLPPTATGTPGPPGVDLIANSMVLVPDGAHRPNADSPFHFSIEVKNAGTAPAPAGSRYEVDTFIHLTRTPETGDTSDTFGAVTLAQPLQPGQSVVVDTAAMRSTTGRLSLYSWVNRYHYLSEADYTNNIIGPMQGCISPHDGATFTDVHAGPDPPLDYFYTPVEYLTCIGAISGYADHTFRPYNYTTRAQFTKMVTLAVGWSLVSAPPNGYTFTDVPPTHPFFLFVETAVSHGVVSGYPCGTTPDEPCDSANRRYYRAGANITRAQLAKIIVLAKGWTPLTPETPRFRDVPTTNAFYPFIETVAEKGVVSGYGCGSGCFEFRPSNPGTRGQLSKMLYLAVTQQ